MKCSIIENNKPCLREANYGKYCHSHYVLYFETKQFPINKYNLVHSTFKEYIEDILKSGYILPTSKTKYEGNWGIDTSKENYKNKIFTSLIYPFNEERFNYTYQFYSFQIYIFFDIEKLYKDGFFDKSHFCNDWFAGDLIKENCLEFKQELSLKRQLNDFRKLDYKNFLEINPIYEVIESKDFNEGAILIYHTFDTRRIRQPQNEMIFNASNGIGLEYVKAIYGLDNKLKEKYQNKYPNINWIDKDNINEFFDYKNYEQKYDKINENNIINYKSLVDDIFKFYYEYEDYILDEDEDNIILNYIEKFEYN